jgi:hypothetical protein
MIAAGRRVVVIDRGSGLAQSVVDVFASGEKSREVTRCDGANAEDAEDELSASPASASDRASGSRPRWAKGERETRRWTVAIGFDGRPEPNYRFLLFAQM